MALTLEDYEKLEEAFGKEKAKIIIPIIEKVVKEKVEEKEQEIKAQIKDDSRNELLTKTEFYSEIKRLDEKIDSKFNMLEKLVLLILGGLVVPLILLILKDFFVR